MIGITETLQAEAKVAADDSTRGDEDNSSNEISCSSSLMATGEVAISFSLYPSNEEFIHMDEDKDVIVDPDASTTSRVSFMRRLARPNNLKLANSRSVTPSENSVDDTDTASDQVDGKRRKSRISKPLDIGFRNLSYSKKTGFFRRGEWEGMWLRLLKWRGVKWNKEDKAVPLQLIIMKIILLHTLDLDMEHCPVHPKSIY